MTMTYLRHISNLMEVEECEERSPPNLMENNAQEMEDYEERSPPNLMEDATQQIKDYEEKSPPNLMEDGTLEEEEEWKLSLSSDETLPDVIWLYFFNIIKKDN